MSDDSSTEFNMVDTEDAGKMPLSPTSTEGQPGAPIFTLPPELREAILTYLPLLTDLMNVCLACKDLKKAATPLLYHTMKLNLGDHNLLRHRMRNNFLVPVVPGRDGLKHTRHLTVLFENAPPRSVYQSNGWKDVMSVTRRLLEHLAHDGLRTLASPRNVPWNLGTILMLFNSQHKLERIEKDTVFLLGSGVKSFTFQNNNFGNLQSLDIPEAVDGFDNVIFNGVLVGSCSRLELDRLALRTRFFINGGRDSGGFHDPGADEEAMLVNTPTGYGTLFATAFTTPGPLSLKELCFQGHDLQFFSTHLPQALNIEVLQFLHLYLCESTGDLLEMLAARNSGEHKSVKLRGLLYEQDWREETEDGRGLETFLRSFKGLEYLQIRCGNSRTPFDPGAALHHNETLRDVYIGIGSSDDDDERPWQWTMNMHDFETLSNVKYLRQVALAVPSFLLSSETRKSAGEKAGKSFPDRLECLSKCAELEILRFLTWPTAGIVDTMPWTPILDTTDNIVTYVRSVDSLAHTIMQRLGTHDRTKSKMRLLVIGDSLDGDDTLAGPFPDLKCICYVPGIQRDHSGREQACAMPVDRTIIERIVPHFDAIKKICSDRYDDFGIGLGDYGVTTHQSRGYTCARNAG